MSTKKVVFPNHLNILTKEKGKQITIKQYKKTKAKIYTEKNRVPSHKPPEPQTAQGNLECFAQSIEHLNWTLRDE